MAGKKSNQIAIDAVSWYSERRPIYEQLSKKVESIIEEIINDKKIHIHAIYSRAKEVDSFSKKIEDPKYHDPINQITDCSGIRVITYVETDLEKVCKVLEEHFDIDPKQSIDKSKSLGIDKVGYRSIHYVCKLPTDRIKLPEYKKFAGLFFEIQVRTILQHGWAEIEHDKDYKFSGELPIYLKRRFKVLAGVLELADREFNQLALEIDKYSASVSADAKKGNLDIPIDSTSLKSFLNLKFASLIKKGLDPGFYDDKSEKRILSELKNFSIYTLKDLDDLIPSNLVSEVLKQLELKSVNVHNFAGMIRYIMIISDIEKYFSKCWNDDWRSISKGSVQLISSFEVPIIEYLAKHHIAQH